MAMIDKRKEDIIQELTRLLIKTDFYEKDKNVTVYVPKKVIYRDVIKMLKEFL